ncbi:MAG: hypothetical protein RL885_18885 [Planctomycetota bacterium]
MSCPGGGHTGKSGHDADKSGQEEGIRQPEAQAPGQSDSNAGRPEDTLGPESSTKRAQRFDPSLEHVIGAWPDLSDPVRRAILALVDSSSPKIR